MSAFRLPKKYIPWIVVFLVLFIDQYTKILVKTSMMLGQSFPVMGDWFIIYFIENKGMAFGMEFSGDYGKLLLSVFRIIAVGFIIWYVGRLIKQNAKPGLIVLISLILAGALGNIIDSAFYGLIFSDSYFRVAEFLPEGGGYASFLHGKVVDMLYFPIIKTTLPQWLPIKGGEEFIFFRPVFNLADSAITVGVFFLLILQKRYFNFDNKQDGFLSGVKTDGPETNPEPLAEPEAEGDHQDAAQQSANA